LVKRSRGNYFLKFLKLFYDFDYIDAFIPPEHFSVYLHDKAGYNKKIFNLFLISHHLLKNSNYVFTDKEKEYFYKNVFYLAFDSFFYLNAEGNVIINYFMLVSYKFCGRNDCKKDILKEIETKELDILKLIK
jgi:hypothetical protein